MPARAVIFDAYGTLFDVYALASTAERFYPGAGTALAQLWRTKQIEYTQLRTMCCMYKPFWEVTQDALVFSCRKLGLALNIEAQNALMGEYARLPVFPECEQVLQQLRTMPLTLAILSNGTTPMLQSALEAAGLRSYFHHVLSADSVQKYKTAPEVYQMGPDVLGLAARDILFVSANGWDACGAGWFGYTTFWVNRQQAPAEELGVLPQGSGNSLQDVVNFLSSNL